MDLTVFIVFSVTISVRYQVSFCLTVALVIASRLLFSGFLDNE
jgi:hypothetical protein